MSLIRNYEKLLRLVIPLICMSGRKVTLECRQSPQVSKCQLEFLAFKHIRLDTFIAKAII